jgi:hypothetical protein
MIVRTEIDGVLLITQPDHAHLSARIMEHCVPLRASPRRASILRAIAEHDNGWTEEDAAPMIDPTTGRIADFVNIPFHVRHGVWPRGVTRLADDPWAAALVAQHAITVYDRFRSDEAWTPFFTRMEDMRTEQVEASGLPLDALLADYPYVRLGDLLSLAFCTAWTDEHRIAGWIVRQTDNRVVVTPGAFGGTEVRFEIQAAEIRCLTFQSDADLRAALKSARTVTLTGAVVDGQRL